MKEIVVISGKGGTGKTSIVASFAALSGNAVLADCDVDAADLYLVLEPVICRREDFRSGYKAFIRQNECIGCGACLARCRFGAVSRVDDAMNNLCFKTTCDNDGCNEHRFLINPFACEGCGVCVWACPVKAIEFSEQLNGEWYVSDTRYGPMVHARLEPGGENSGKLVSKIREVARELAEERKTDIILVDGPPGIGCAVIASMSGASHVVIVTEPTLSGIHDMKRVIELTRHFNIPYVACLVNKWDLNPEITEQIESFARQAGVITAGRVRYDQSVTDAQIQGKAVVELDRTAAGGDILTLWEKIYG